MSRKPAPKGRSSTPASAGALAMAGASVARPPQPGAICTFFGRLCPASAMQAFVFLSWGERPGAVVPTLIAGDSGAPGGCTGGRGAKVAASRRPPRRDTSSPQHSRAAGESNRSGDRGLEQHVAVVEQDLAVSAQAEGFEGVELREPGDEVRARDAERRKAGAQCRGDGLEAQSGAGLREVAAMRFGQCVVDDDEVAVEAGVVFQERAEGGERARYEAFRGRGDEAGLSCCAGPHGGIAPEGRRGEGVRRLAMEVLPSSAWAVSRAFGVGR